MWSHVTWTVIALPPLQHNVAVCGQSPPCLPLLQAFSAIYARLGVTLQERGESFYNPRLREAVEELQAMGVAEESEGAVVVWTKVRWLPCN